MRFDFLRQARTHTHTHTHTRARVTTHTHTHTHVHTHTHTHAHVPDKNVFDEPALAAAAGSWIAGSRNRTLQNKHAETWADTSTKALLRLPVS